MALANPQTPAAQAETHETKPEAPTNTEAQKESPKSGRGKMVVASCVLHDTDIKVTFYPEIPVEVPRVTPWMEHQINAGLMKVL